MAETEYIHSEDAYLLQRQVSLEKENVIRRQVALTQIESLLLTMGLHPDIVKTAAIDRLDNKIIPTSSSTPTDSKEIIEDIDEVCNQVYHTKPNYHLYLMAPGTKTAKGTKYQLSRSEDEQMQLGCVNSFIKLLQEQDRNPPEKRKIVANAEEIKAAINLFFENECKSVLRVVIFFIGHGSPSGLHLEDEKKRESTMHRDELIALIENHASLAVTKHGYAAPKTIELVFTECYGQHHGESVTINIVSLATDSKSLTFFGFTKSNLDCSKNNNLNLYAPLEAQMMEVANNTLKQANKDDALEHATTGIKNIDVHSTESVDIEGVIAYDTVASASATLVANIGDAAEPLYIERQMYDRNQETVNANRAPERLEMLNELRQAIEKYTYSVVRTPEGEKVFKLLVDMCSFPAQARLQNGDTPLVNHVKRMYDFLSNELLKRDALDPGYKQNHFDIVVVSHGCIRNHVPYVHNLNDAIYHHMVEPIDNYTGFRHVKEVVLYAPWNCLLRRDAGLSIAANTMQLEQRRIDNLYVQNYQQPLAWNNIFSTQHAQGCIPEILLSVVDGNLVIPPTPPNRIVVPYTAPVDAQGKAISEFPQRTKFSIVVNAIGAVGAVLNFTCTVHLVACLRKEEITDPYPEVLEELCRNQYSYVNPQAVMTSSLPPAQLCPSLQGQALNDALASFELFLQPE